jgi:flagellar export protein FliJ
MKRFQFRLQTALEQRQRVETQAQMTHAEADRLLRQAQIFLTELKDIHSAILSELSDRRTSGDFDPQETQLYQEYLVTVSTAIRDQTVHVQDLFTTAEALRLHLVGASQNRQVLDKARERAEITHRDLLIRADQAINDELASVRFQFQRTQENAA